MQKKKIIFRADGNSQIGLGHVMRCLALGEMLKNYFELFFAIQEPSHTITQLLENESFKIVELPKTLDFKVDSENLTLLLDGSEIVVLDGYNFKETYQKTIKIACRKLVYIDDLAAWHQYADVIINHGGLAQQSDYQAEKYTEFLLGTDYALLRSAFLNRKSKIVVPNRYKKYLVNFGGADPLNLTLQVCESLLENEESDKLKITAIVGDNYQYLSELKTLEQKGLTVLQNLSAEQMVKQIESHQVVICSPSTIAYEVATIGKSLLLIQTADNQTKIAQFFEEKDLALFVEKAGFNLFSLLPLTFLPVSVKRQKIINQQKYFDGKSGQRLLDVFNKL